MGMTTDLRGALDHGEISALYQPQFDIASGRIVAVEALARWRRHAEGSVSPSVFIPLAEEHDLIAEIGRFMLDTACRCAVEWAGLGIDLEVAVNVSASQLASDSFVEFVIERLHSLGLDPSKLTVEVTESQAIADHATVSKRLQRLCRLGVGVSIDDFGTGHSSLSQLDGLPASELKIDQSIVQGDPVLSTVLMAPVVARAAAHGIRVVAEGVETDAQLEWARELGCHRAQGFLLAKPVLAAEIESLALAQR